MTTMRMYRCNLCTDFIQPTDSTSKEGFGVKYGSPVVKGHISLVRPHEAERHICLLCARGIQDALLRRGSL